MKQLTIYCSKELENNVNQVFHKYESKIAGIIEALQTFANNCDIQPCLRMVVTPVEKFI